MSVRQCPSCKSERCGNHAACARRKEQNTKLILDEVLKLGREIEVKERRVLVKAEWVQLTEDFMRGLTKALDNEKTS